MTLYEAVALALIFGLTAGYLLGNIDKPVERHVVFVKDFGDEE